MAEEEFTDRTHEHFTTRINDIRSDFLEHQRTTQDQIDRRMEVQRREVDLRFEAAAKAIEKAEADNTRRFQANNEWRGQLSDQASRFAIREAVEKEFEALRQQILANTHAIDVQAGAVQGDEQSRRRSSSERSLTIGSVAAGTGILTVVIIVLNFLTAH